MKVTLITATLTLAGANSKQLSSLRRRLPSSNGTFFLEPTYWRKIDAKKDVPIPFEKIESGETYALEVVPESGKFYLADCDYVNRRAMKAMFRNPTNAVGGAIKGKCLWLTYPKDLGRVLPQNCVNAKSSANSPLRLRLPGDNFFRHVGRGYCPPVEKWAKDIPTPGLGGDSGNCSPIDPKMDSGSDSSDSDVGEDEKAHWNHEFPTDTVVKIFVDEQESPTDEANSKKVIYTKVTRGWFRKRMCVDGRLFGKIFDKKVKPEYLHKIDVTRDLNDEYWNTIFKIGDMVHVVVHLDDGKEEMVRVVARECVDGVIGLRLAPGQKGDEKILEVDPRCLTKIEIRD